MNANELLMYLKGFFENVPNPSKAQVSGIRDVVLRSTIVEPEKEVIPVHVAMPMQAAPYSVGSFGSDSGCSSRGSCGKPEPYIDPSLF